MPVYNGERYIAEAIESVLAQIFEDYELIIINDGSTDSTREVVGNFIDPRITFVENNGNQGVAYTRNRGLQMANGKYLAWMDSDDLIDPRRFEKQITFMQKHPEFGLCGTWLERFARTRTGTFQAPSDPEIVKAMLLFKPSIPNATAMLRMSMIRKHRLLYNETLPIAEDYDFVFRCSKHFKMTNLREILYSYRDSETSIMKKFGSEEAKHYEIHKGVYAETLKYLGIEPNEEELHLHWTVASEKKILDKAVYIKGLEWLLRLREVNQQTKIYSDRAFNAVLKEMFYFMSTKSSGIGIRVFMLYLTRSATEFGMPNWKRSLKLAIRCVLRYNEF
jgi:glycosyltransferase involved in cell wall biosynthesis